MVGGGGGWAGKQTCVGGDGDGVKSYWGKRRGRDREERERERELEREKGIVRIVNWRHRSGEQRGCFPSRAILWPWGQGVWGEHYHSL